jgi:lipopolysaccharide transport system ATP-binding protein
MSNESIKVEGLGKRYQISHSGSKKAAGYDTVRDSLVQIAKFPIKRAAALLKGDAYGATGLSEDFWALTDVSFDVKQGDVLGIVGRNGAGKTTLLKILSRITEPTTGSVTQYGRVGSLLEVGTGFHPELTGRENLYLNGAILGMRKAEINAQFDEIVAFAEVEQFIDTPVKFYSTGMQVRLAFAVAAHLDPEILIIDEVLAVGDIKFQQKCLGKMEEIGSSGRTVLFVSHNMPAVSRLCTRAVLLEQGKLVEDGTVTEVISKYVGGGQTLASRSWSDDEQNPGDEIIRLNSIRAINEANETSDPFDIRERIGIEVEFELLKGDVWFTSGFNITNADGQMLFNATESTDPDWDNGRQPAGRYKTTAWIPGNFFAEGLHFVNFTFFGFEHQPVKKAAAPSVIAFNIVDPLQGGSVRGTYSGTFPGLVRPMLDWKSELLS